MNRLWNSQFLRNGWFFVLFWYLPLWAGGTPDPSGEPCRSALLGSHRVAALEELGKKGYETHLLHRKGPKSRSQGILLVTRSPDSTPDAELEAEAHSGGDLFLGWVSHHLLAEPVKSGIDSHPITSPLERGDQRKRDVAGNNTLDVSGETRFLHHPEVPSQLSRTVDGQADSFAGGSIVGALAGMVTGAISHEFGGRSMEVSGSWLARALDWYPGIARVSHEAGEILMIHGTPFGWANGILAGVVTGGVFFLSSVQKHWKHDAWVRSRAVDETTDNQNPAQSASFVAEWADKYLTTRRWLLVLYVDTSENAAAMAEWLQGNEGYTVYE